MPDGIHPHDKKEGMHRLEAVGANRRDFLQLLGVAGAGAVAGCTGTTEERDASDPDSKLNKDKQDAYEYWEHITSVMNWGYDATQLREYHERFPEEKGEGINITIIDSGFDTSHPLFNPVDKGEPHREYHVNVVNRECFGNDCEGIDDWNPDRDLLDNVRDVIADQTDWVIKTPKYHGTYVTGVVWQAAPNANYTIIRSGSDNKDEEKLQQIYQDEIEFAQQQTEYPPDAIVLSTGFHPNDIPSDIVESINNAYDEAADDTVIVAAAGNKEHEYPAPPSTASKVISVSSVKREFSQTPSYPYLFADGSPKNPLDNYEKPNIAAPGRHVETIAHSADFDHLSDLETATQHGSSYASPHVGGIVALLSAYGNPDTIRDAIYHSAEPVTAEDGEDGLAGHGAVSIIGAAIELRDDFLHPSFSYSPESPTVGESVTFEAYTPDEIEIEEYRWNIENKAELTGKEIIYEFSEPGKYTVALTVVDSEGNVDNSDQTVIVGEEAADDPALTVQLLDAETDAPISNGTVTLMYFEQADNPFGPRATDDDGMVIYEKIDVEGEYGVRGRAAGYAEHQREFTWEEGDSVVISVELEPEDEVERSIITVTVVDAATGDPVQTLPNVYVDHDGERVESVRANDQGEAQISVEDGREYTVSAMDEIPRTSEEQAVTVDGDTEITLHIDEDEDDDEPAELVIDEMEHINEGEPNRERVIFRNPGSQSLDLTGWRVEGSASQQGHICPAEPYNFPEDTVLQPNDTYEMRIDGIWLSVAGEEILVRNADNDVMLSEPIRPSEEPSHIGLVHVVDEDGNPVEGEPVTIEYEDHDGSVIEEKTTNSKGKVVVVSQDIGCDQGVLRDVTVRDQTKELRVFTGTETIEFIVGDDDGLDPARFVVDIINAPSRIEVGEDLVIEAEIENVGDKTGRADIYVHRVSSNGDYDIQGGDGISLELRGGESRRVTFINNFDEIIPANEGVGKHEFSVDQDADRLNPPENAPDDVDPDSIEVTVEDPSEQDDKEHEDNEGE